MIVFDNYQNLPQESPFHDILVAALSRVPDDIRVVIISRTEHPPAFTGMLADDRMRTIGWEEIRFAPDESDGMVRLHFPGREGGEDLAWMYERSRGWAAGLVLLAKAAKANALDPPSMSALAPEQVFDYFASELFDKRTDAATKEFLLKTAVLPRMTPPIAEKLTGNKEADRILSELNRRNYFTEKRFSQELNYQYHPLFREFLLTRARKVLSSDDIARLQCAGAAFLGQTGQFEDAAALYIEAKEWNGLVSLILTHARTLVVQGRAATLEQWLFSLPQDVIERTPWLLFWRAVCRQPFNPAEAKRYFEKAFTIFDAQKETTGALLSWSSCVDTFLFEWNDFTPLDQWIKRLDGQLRAGLKFPAPEIEARVATSMAAALMIRQPHRPDITRWLERALSLSRRLGDVNHLVQACSFAVNYYFWIGDFTRMSSINREIRALALSPGASPLVKITWLWLESAADICVSGAPGASLQRVSEALKLAESTGIHVWDHMLFALGVYGAHVLGDFAKAEGFLMRAEATLDSCRRHAYCHYNFLISWHRLLKGKLPEAAESARTALDIAEETGYVFPIILCGFAMAHVLHAQGMERDAEARLAHAYKLSLRTRSRIFQYMCLLSQAWIAFNRGKEQKGLSPLREAMKIGRENGYLTPLWWWNAPVMARLCEKALEAGIEAGYVQEIIRKHNLISDTPPLHIEMWPWPVKVHTLGRFRITVNDTPLAFPGKAQKKPLELLKALIALGGRDVGQEQITDVLWPDAEGDHAHKSFEMALQRLRRMLGRDDAVRLQSGQVSLDDRLCWTDVGVFDRLQSDAERQFGGGQAKRRGKAGLAHRDLPAAVEKALALYQGQFLPEDVRQPWSVAMRERMRSRFLRLIVRTGGQFEKSRQWQKAVELYDRGVETEALAEELYQRLMVCHQRLGQEAKGVMAYRRCKTALLRDLGIAPSSQTETIYRQILSARR